MTNWNIMLYMAGDNNLSEEMVWAQHDLEKQVPPNAVISVQFDARASYIPVHRYVLKAGEKIQRHPVRTHGPEFDRFMDDRNSVRIGPREKLVPEDSGNPTTLLNFIWWATRQATQKPDLAYAESWDYGKAKEWKHLLILSGHGAGSENDFLSDDTSRDSLTIPELSAVLADATLLIFGKDDTGQAQGKIDILGMDSCMMSTAEVYYQVRDSVRYLVAAEGFEPNSGWPYAQMLEKLQQRSAIDEPSDMAMNIVRDYIGYYTEYAYNGGQSVDLSACNVSCDFKKEMNDFSGALIEALKTDDDLVRDSIIMAHWWAQTYKSDQYVDLVDFADRLLNSPGLKNTHIPDSCTALIKVITGKETLKAKEDAHPDRVVLLSAYAGPAFQFSNGLSVYFPWSADSRQYVPKKNQESLLFASDTNWHEFLDVYETKTCRTHRGGGELPIDSFMKDEMNRVRSSARRPVSASVQSGSPHRWNDPYNRGTVAIKSMKNPALAWRLCCVICKDLPEPPHSCDADLMPADCPLAR